MSGIKFCPKCGGVMYPKAASGARLMYCPRCGHEEAGGSPSMYKVTTRITHSPRERTIVLKGAEPSVASVVKGELRCPKCGHDELLYWMMQTRAADEPPTRFYRCKKCGHTWREYA